MFTPRADVGKSSYALVQPAQAEAQSGDWLAGKLNGDGEPEVIVAPIAAGEQLVASTRSEMHAFIRAHDDRAVAVEIESRGFLAALHANQNVDALRVRGISDLLDAKSVSDDEGWQQRASRSTPPKRVGHGAYRYQSRGPAHLQASDSILRPHS
ncbi:MAG: 5'-methylthioadenosine/S-adenosylhomocysteine nucleosidase [Actinobacteria bacterium]|nr:MAG: 5'-methylthioadenosine/S-adenosylhomocysteine nucleosidase [Actinomycetota bacterium]